MDENCVALVASPASGEEFSSNNDGNVVLEDETRSALARGQDKGRSDDGTSAEVHSIGTTEGGKVRHLAGVHVPVRLKGWEGKIDF